MLRGVCSEPLRSAQSDSKKSESAQQNIMGTFSSACKAHSTKLLKKIVDNWISTVTRTQGQSLPHYLASLHWRKGTASRTPAPRVPIGGCRERGALSGRSFRKNSGVSTTRHRRSGVDQRRWSRATITFIFRPWNLCV